MRRLAAIVLASAFVVSVAACSDLPAEVQGCVSPYKAGDASKSITASGPFGGIPAANVPVPSLTTKVEVSTLKAGTGLLLGPGDIGEFSSTEYLGSTGARITSTATDDKFTKANRIQLQIGGAKSLPITRSFLCERVGSRVVTVLTASQAYGGAQNATGDGFDPKATIVLVSDIVGGYRGRATGILQPPQAGFPSVVTSGNGTPGLTFDLQEPPKTLQYEVVRRGSGAKVKAGEKVLLQVQAVEWTNPASTSTFDSTWSSPASPRFYTLTALSQVTGDPNGTALDPGSVKALVGQTIGSQVLVVVPAKYGYPSGKAPSGYPTKSTLVFVYDILGKY